MQTLHSALGLFSHTHKLNPPQSSRVCYPTEKNMNAGNHLVGGRNHSDSFGFFIVVVIFIVSITIIVFVIVFVFVIFNIMNGGSQSDSFGFRVDSPPSAQSVFNVGSTIISTKTLLGEIIQICFWHHWWSAEMYRWLNIFEKWNNYIWETRQIYFTNEKIKETLCKAG